MVRLKIMVFFFVASLFVFSCTKEKQPPALGDHTEKPDNPNGSGGSSSSGKASVVLSLGANWGDIFTAGPKGTLYIRNSTKVFNVYTPGEDGKFGKANPFPGDPWGVSANAYYMGKSQAVETMMVVNIPPAGLFRFDVKPTGFLEIHPTTNPADPWPSNFGFWYGDGWDNYDIIAFKEKFVFQISHNKGEALFRSNFAEFMDDWSTWNRPATLKRDDLNKKFDGYLGAMAMGDSLLIVEKSGNLTAYAVDGTGNLGSNTKVGSGWEVYKKFAAVGNDILAIDNKGDVYRYKIDLKKTNNDAIKP